MRPATQPQNQHPRVPAPRHSRPPTPYNRPGRTPTNSSSVTVAPPPTVQAAPPTLVQLLQEIKLCREEITKISGDIKRMGQKLMKLQDNYAQLRIDFKDQSDASFSIEASTFKVRYRNG